MPTIKNPVTIFGAPTLKSKAITENGYYPADNDSADGYSSVTVSVPQYTDTSDANIAAGDVMNGKIAYGASGKVIGNYVPLDTSDATATAGDIMSGETAYVDGVKITGNYTPPAPPVMTTKTITDNGAYPASDESAAGFSSVTVALPLGTKSITANGTYAASDDSLKGFSSVTVNVPAPASKFTAMADGSITSVTAEDLSGVTVIAKYAFYQKELLQSVVLPSGITEIGQGAFEDCDILASVNLPNTVTVIGQTAFRNSRVIQWGNLVLPPNITALTQEVFRNCRLMTSIDIPSGVTTIGQQALSGCQGLTSITIRRTAGVVTLESSNALNNTNNCPIYVPAALVEDYKVATNWASYASRIQAIPSA